MLLGMPRSRLRYPAERPAFWRLAGRVYFSRWVLCRHSATKARIRHNAQEVVRARDRPSRQVPPPFCMNHWWPDALEATHDLAQDDPQENIRRVGVRPLARRIAGIGSGFHA